MHIQNQMHSTGFYLYPYGEYDATTESKMQYPGFTYFQKQYEVHLK